MIDKFFADTVNLEGSELLSRAYIDLPTNEYKKFQSIFDAGIEKEIDSHYDEVNVLESRVDGLQSQSSDFIAHERYVRDSINDLINEFNGSKINVAEFVIRLTSIKEEMWV